MINTKDEVIINLETSCTQDIAAAKLLGWMQGPHRSKIIQITGSGEISEDELRFLPYLTGPLSSFLEEQRESLRHEHARSIKAEAEDKIIEEKLEAIIAWEKRTLDAYSYLQDIADEIAKGKDSALRIDQSATALSGVLHITLKSLDLWAKDEYGLSIFAPSTSDSVVLKSPENSQPEGDDDLKIGLTKVKAENLYTSLAFAIDAIAKAYPEFRKGNEEPNVISIAQHISVLAKQGKEELAGQGIVAIRKRIEDAMRIKKKKIRGG